MILHSLLLLGSWTFACEAGKKQNSNDCSWNNCNAWSADPSVLNVHLIPHTHDDLGWIKTVDQYYFGSKPELVPVGVQYIYNTVIEELMNDPNRRFSFAETGFLSRWMQNHADYDKHKMHQLVKNGQVEIIGGGWVQNDEAAAHYVDIIDQMELGLKYLDLQFGKCGQPQTAWQIDPFGHSREVANLFAMMGYSSLFFARIHYLEKQSRLANKSLEFVWNTSDDLKNDILTGAFFQDNYGPPPGFCFDALCGDDPIQDNGDMEGYNLPQKITEFSEHIRKQASSQRTKHVLLLMGSDFQYTNANMWFTNLDKLIAAVNGNSSLGIRVFYSTPSCYARAINEVAPRLDVKNDDFFPYASSNHSFWTGFFTSRPTWKRMIREASATLQLAKQLDVMAFLGAEDDSDVEMMKESSALSQHHDAVTGTARENVTRDYEKRLAASMAEAENVINDALARLSILGDGKELPFPHFICPLLNETVCAPLKSLPTYAVTIFNSRPARVQEVLRLPFYSRQAIVLNAKGESVNVQLSKTFQNALPTPERAPFELALPVDLPPLGFATYFFDNSASIRSTKVTQPQRIRDTAASFIENQFLRVNFDESAGFVKSVLDKTTNVSHIFKQELLYYEGFDSKKEQISGAYVFRPKTNVAKPIASSCKIEFSKGPLVQEARQTISQWASQSIRLYNDTRYIEFAWTIGPIPKEAKEPVTKEVITRYSTQLKTSGTFFTDANGRQIMQRQRNSNPTFTYANTEPIAANYYPITSSVYMRDASSQCSVLTDRSEGASSPAEGVIDIMLHRRCFYDDHWGVDEALDELGVDGKGLIAHGTHRVHIGSFEDASTFVRLGAQSVFHRPYPAFAPIPNITSYTTKMKSLFSGMLRPLPDNINLLTLSKWRGSQLLIRLEHIYQSGDENGAASPVTINLKDIFTTFSVTKMKEVLLSGIREVSAKKWHDGDLVVALNPMEIRTFILDVVERKMWK